jgi:VanZ family protein
MRMPPPRRLDLWLPPLALMGVIFALSAQPSLDTGLGLIDTIGRKFVHLGQYALLAFLWWRAMRTRLEGRQAAVAAFVITALYAGSDEYHQSFVEGRSGSPVDWAIDCAGAAIACLWLARRPARREARA